MSLFLTGFDRALGCDAYLIDTTRPARVLRVHGQAPAVVETLLSKLLLMGKSLSAVADLTFAVFFSPAPGVCDVGLSSPFHEGAFSSLASSLHAIGRVEPAGEVSLRETALEPLFAYERGRVTFLHTAVSHAYLPLAGRRAVRIVSATTLHAPDPEVYVGETPAPDAVQGILRARAEDEA